MQDRQREIMAIHCRSFTHYDEKLRRYCRMHDQTDNRHEKKDAAQQIDDFMSWQIQLMKQREVDANKSRQHYKKNHYGGNRKLN